MRNMDPQSVADRAVRVIGYGYDLTTDLRLSACKAGPSDSRLIVIDQRLSRDLVLPGGIIVPNVPSSIHSDKGERTRFRSDVLTFNQMSEHFNQENSLSGKIPSGHFNRMFDFNGGWQKDAGLTKSLAFDGCFITLYTIELAKSHITLSEDIKREVPLSWDPAALAAFIDKFGTHVVIGVKMGGKDVIHIKQHKSSNIEPAEVQNLLKKLADERFSENVLNLGAHGKPKENNRSNWQVPASLPHSNRPSVTPHSKNDDLMSIAIRRGGVDLGTHKQWVSTISESPNVISMSFVPITSLLSGVQGCGFLSHAVNLYLRYKPPIEELTEFLEFQLPRQWAPAYGDLPLGLRRKKDASPSLPYGLMGPKLYVNIVPVDTTERPVTGIRLFLEGKRSDRLAIHLQHLSALPKIIQLSDDHNWQHSKDEHLQKDYIEPIKWSMFSHVYTAPVEYNNLSSDDTAPIVTRAWFEVKSSGMKKILFLRLGFSMVASAKLRRSEWDETTTVSRKSGMFSKISGRFSGALNPQPEIQKPEINSALYPGGPPAPASAPKLSNIVDTKEMVRGPEDHPGYWVVTGAKLCMQGGKISIKTKFSLLTIITDSEDSMSM